MVIENSGVKILSAWLRLAFLLFSPVLIAAAPDQAPVVVDGRELWTVRAPRADFDIDARAKDVSSSIVNIAADIRRNLNDVREVRLDTESILLVSRVYVFSVTEEDARLEGKDREAIFSQRRQIVIDAIGRYRHDRSFGIFARSVALALAALIVGVALLALLRVVYRRLKVWSSKWLPGLSLSGNLASLYRIFEGPLDLLLRLLLRASFAVVALAIIFIDLSFVLGLFPATAGLADTAVDGTWSVLTKVGSNIVSYLPNFVILVLIVLVTYTLIRTARAVAQAVNTGVMTIPGFHRDWATPTYDLVKILLVLFALVVSFPYLPGGDSPALKGASIFIGILVSLGSGSAMGNVIAGVILTYMRPFRTGDRVRIADTTGDVLEKTLLVTRIRTIKNVEVIIPNGAVLGAHILNYSAHAKQNGLILNTTVTIGYEVHWSAVHQVLIRAALRTPYIRPEPSPYVLQTSLNDYHISYEINAFTDQANRMAEIYSEFHKCIHEEFNAAGLEIMSPSYVAIRDGNTVTNPEDKIQSGHTAPSFRIKLQR